MPNITPHAMRSEDKQCTDRTSAEFVCIPSESVIAMSYLPTAAQMTLQSQTLTSTERTHKYNSNNINNNNSYCYY